jgi:ankyrin repeat protein
MASYSNEKSQRFHHAMFRGDLALVKTLSVDPEVDLNWRDGLGYTPFAQACRSDRVDLIRYMLDFKERPTDYNRATDSGHVPFAITCALDREESAKMLLGDMRIDINKANEDGRTPLWWASCRGRLHIIQLILASGRHIDTLKADADGYTAVGIAEWYSDALPHRSIIIALLNSFEKNPEETRFRLRVALGYPSESAAELFASIVFLSDEYLKIKEEE